MTLLAKASAFLLATLMVQCFVANIVSSVTALLAFHAGKATILWVGLSVSPLVMFAAHTFAATLAAFIFAQNFRFLFHKDAAQEKSKPS